MATLNFPLSPSLNDEYTLNGKTWIWNGSAWDLSSSATAEYTSLKLLGGNGEQGTLTWNGISQTLDLVMNQYSIQQIGEEVYLPLVKNNTLSTIANGIPVVISGSDGTYFFIEPADATNPDHQERYLGLTTQEILTGEVGRVTFYGYVRSINTSTFLIGDRLFVDPSSPGTIVNQKPSYPNHSIFIGNVQSVGVNGTVLVRPVFIQEAHDVTYDNQISELQASSVQAAIDELESTKADISLLNADINLYATNVTSTIPGYFKLVNSIDAVDYNTTAVNIPTGPISTSGQLLASLVSEPGLFIGNPGTVSIPTIGNIAKTAGNSNNYAQFYFQVYRRSSTGVETLQCTSSTTEAVNPETLNVYQQFSATAILNNGSWSPTDRVVLKFYANAVEGTSSQYNFEFGGSSPVRTTLRVPVTVTANVVSTNIIIDTDTFNNILDPTDYNLQTALETLDDHTHDNRYLQLSSGGAVTGHTQFNTSSIVQHSITANTATTNLDFNTYQNFYITLGANTQFTVSGLATRIGSSGILVIKQNSTGGYQFTKAAEMKTPVGGASIVQVTAANSLSTLSYYIVDSATIIVNYIGDFA